VALVASLALAGCSSDNNPVAPPAGSTSFQGTLAGPSLSGTVALTVATSSPIPQPGSTRSQHEVAASGTLRLSGGGATIALTGTYSDEENLLVVSGGGYTLTGTYTAVGITGTFVGPSENGYFDVQTRGTGADTVRTFIGAFTGLLESGNFNFGLRGSVLKGVAVTSAGDLTPLGGTYASSNDSIHVVNPVNPTGPALAWGTLQANGHVNGLFDDRAGNSGTWSGDKSN
jgi:hypothetical protein